MSIPREVAKTIVEALGRIPPNDRLGFLFGLVVGGLREQGMTDAAIEADVRRGLGIAGVELSKTINRKQLVDLLRRHDMQVVWLDEIADLNADRSVLRAIRDANKLRAIFRDALRELGEHAGD